MSCSGFGLNVQEILLSMQRQSQPMVQEVPSTLPTMTITMIDLMQFSPGWSTSVNPRTGKAYYYDDATLGDKDDSNDRFPVLIAAVAPSDFLLTL